LCRSSVYASRPPPAAWRAPAPHSSLAFASTSPCCVDHVVGESAAGRKSSGGYFWEAACSISRTCLTVMRLSLATIVCPSPGCRSAPYRTHALRTSSNSTRRVTWTASNTKNYLISAPACTQRFQQIVPASCDGDDAEIQVTFGRTRSRATAAVGITPPRTAACPRVRLPPSCSENTPATVSCDTCNRSVPLMKKEPVEVMSGSRPNTPPAPSLPWASAWRLPCP